MPRQLSDVISAYLEYTDPTEPPLSFRLWSVLSVISATLERRCWMEWGYDTIYPNQYIILVGPSGQTRKGASLKVARDLMEAVDIDLIAQSITREKLINRMKDNLKTFKNPISGGIEYHSSTACISEELAVFIRGGDTDFIANLTDWYDSHPIWTYDTKNRSTDSIQGMCFNLLGATTPTWIPLMLPKEAIGGGWTSRVIFVMEEYKGKIIADPNSLKKDQDLLDAIINDLSIIRNMNGPFEFSEEAKDAYIKWYQSYEEGIRMGKPPIPDPRFSGYLARRATHIKKVCMAISASRGEDMIITETDFKRARLVLEETEKKMQAVFRGVGENKFAYACEMLLSTLDVNDKVARSSLLRKHYERMDSWTLEKVVHMLQLAQMIKIEIVPEEREEYYYKGSGYVDRSSGTINVQKAVEI